MSRTPALAVVDFADIPAGVVATDALVKTSPIAWVRSGTVSRARYLTLFGGSPAAVEVALERCLESAGPAAMDHVLLANAHEALVAGLGGTREKVDGGALAILQTTTAAASVHAAERALKTAPVTLVEIRLAEPELDGKAIVTFHGELHDIEAAMDAASAALAGRSGEVHLEIIAAPSESLWKRFAAASGFAGAATIKLPGEKG
jgi:microcompartment protein CcmL/EutN